MVGRGHHETAGTYLIPVIAETVDVNYGYNRVRRELVKRLRWPAPAEKKVFDPDENHTGSNEPLYTRIRGRSRKSKNPLEQLSDGEMRIREAEYLRAAWVDKPMRNVIERLGS
jgi:hypothetical protein